MELGICDLEKCQKDKHDRAGTNPSREAQLDTEPLTRASLGIHTCRNHGKHSKGAQELSPHKNFPGSSHSGESSEAKNLTQHLE